MRWTYPGSEKAARKKLQMTSEKRTFTIHSQIIPLLFSFGETEIYIRSSK